MALAAGDTPSPEMVAAAGTDVRLRPAVAWTLLAVSLAGMLAAASIAGQVVMFRAAAPVKPPDVLVERSREMLRAAGFSERPQDSAWGLGVNFAYLNHLSSGPAGGSALDDAVVFWYRESPVLIERLAFLNPDVLPRVGYNDPNLRFSGEVRISLDRHGRLILLTAIPPQRATPGEVAPEPSWAELFKAAGLDLGAWTPAAPEWTPFYFGERRVAWVPRAGGAPGPLRVEGASFHSRPVQFAVIFPWTVPERMQATRRTPGERVGNLIGVLIFSALMLGSALVARRNMRLDRTDWRGATRLAFFVMALLLGVWLLDESHVPSIWELYLFIMAAGWTLFIGALAALLYLALEPYVRRLWPTTIVSWSRIIAGTIRDPLVARDVLIGCAAGGVMVAVQMAGFAVAREVSGVTPRVFSSYRPLMGAPHVASEVAMTLIGSTFFALVYLFVLFSLRQLLRREWIAVVVGALMLSVPNALGSVAHVTSMPLLFAADLMAFTLLARVGLVAMIAANIAGSMMIMFPVTLDRTQWYAGTGFVGLALAAALAIAAFRIATAPAARHHGAVNVPSTPS
jgi:serine/threonine-protein kinase